VVPWKGQPRQDRVEPEQEAGHGAESQV
jgi:hypothetical protein